MAHAVGHRRQQFRLPGSRSGACEPVNTGHLVSLSGSGSFCMRRWSGGLGRRPWGLGTLRDGSRDVVVDGNRSVTGSGPGLETSLLTATSHEPALVGRGDLS